MRHGIYHVIHRPVISEKSTALAEVGNRYVFEVEPAASKTEIRHAIETLFKVHVSRVRTLVVPGKTKQAGKKLVKRPSWKKAIVTIRAGEKIEVFEGTQAKTT